MIISYWNSLRVHDEVYVHDDDDRGFRISTGWVAFVGSGTDSNSVTVRIPNVDGSSRLVHPKRLAVHLHAPGSRTDCWRCGLRQ